MPVPHVLILNGGGLRGLVATALTRREADKMRLTLLYVGDGRTSDPQRRHHFHQQAEHLRIARMLELEATHIFAHGHGQQPDGRPLGPLAGPQLLLAALAQARLAQAERVVWPIACDGQAGTIARVTEQMVLCAHLAQIDEGPAPLLEAPLLEFTDQQIVELGAQLDVPWQLAWSCLFSGEGACNVCPNCRRRKLAFEKAGLADAGAAE